MRVVCFIFLIIYSCSQKQKINEEMCVIGKVYNYIPKAIPSFPALKESNIDTINKSVAEIAKDSLYFNYAIYSGFINVSINEKFDGYFYTIGGNVFKKEKINSSYTSILKQLNALSTEAYFNKEVFRNSIKDDVLFINNSITDDNLKKENKIDGVLSFSRVSFNEEKSRAAIIVSNNKGKLNSSLIIYLLHKTNNDWQITHYLPLEWS